MWQSQVEVAEVNQIAFLFGRLGIFIWYFRPLKNLED